MKEQYESLIQGQMSVREYFMKFRELTWYAPNDDEMDRNVRFKKGLITQLHNKMGGLLFNTLQKVVTSATMFETTYDHLNGVLGNKRNDSGNRSRNRSSNHNKDGQNQQNGNQNCGYQGNQNKNDRADGTFADKRQRVDRFGGNCFNCNRAGHKKVECRFSGGGAYVPQD